MKMPMPISLALVCVIIAAAFGAAAYFIYRDNARLSAWPSVPGVVTGSDKKLAIVESGDNPPKNLSAWRPVITYSYKVNRVSYAGNSIGHASHDEIINAKLLGPTDYATVPPSAKFQALLNKYAVGTPVTVYYNPANPEEAVLEPNDARNLYISSAVSAAALLLAVIFVLYYFLAKKA